MLEINTSPNKFLPKNNKRLSKVPIIILFTIAVIVLFSVFYVALSRKQNLEKQATQTAPKEETQSTSKIENIASYVDELSQTKQIKEQNSTLQPVNNTIPITQQVQQEIKPQPIQTPILMQNNEIDERELRLKKDMQLKALISQTSLGIKSEIQEKSTIGNHFTVPTNL